MFLNAELRLLLLWDRLLVMLRLLLRWLMLAWMLSKLILL